MEKSIIRITFLIIAWLMLGNLNGQNLNQHKWKNRILIIQASSELNQKYQAQIDAFRNSEEGFRERKLIVYIVIGNKYKLTDYQAEKKETHWENAKVMYGPILDANDTFEIMLIGLDGGTKLVQKEVLNTIELLNIIDAMPMRNAELRNKNR